MWRDPNKNEQEAVKTKPRSAAIKYLYLHIIMSMDIVLLF